MRIVPVIDLMGGHVVRGVAGRRAEYRPIQSQLTPSSDPLEVASALVDRFGFTEMYLADLDAIASSEPAASTYRALGESVGLWIDAGLGDEARAHKLAESGLAHRLIVGLESIAGWSAFESLLPTIGSERFVFSLDLLAGRVLSKAPDFEKLSPLQIAKQAIARGAQRLIVLDLAGVGMGSGPPTLELCRAIRTHAPDVELISGGGVSGTADLAALADAGCNAALVASALHDGRLTPESLREHGWI